MSAVELGAVGIIAIVILMLVVVVVDRFFEDE